MSHDEKLYPLGAPVASLGDLQALAYAGGWVWSQNAGKAILAADLLALTGWELLKHFTAGGMKVWHPETSAPPVSDAPKKGKADNRDAPGPGVMVNPNGPLLPRPKDCGYRAVEVINLLNEAEMKLKEIAEAVRPHRHIDDLSDADTIRRVYAELDELRARDAAVPAGLPRDANGRPMMVPEVLMMAGVAAAVPGEVTAIGDLECLGREPGVMIACKREDLEALKVNLLGKEVSIVRFKK